MISQLIFQTTDVYIKNPKTFLLQKLAVMDQALAKLRETSLVKKTRLAVRVIINSFVASASFVVGVIF